MRRVVVTGSGMVSPVGNTVQESWDRVLAGDTGVSKITHFDSSSLRVQIAAEVKNFDASHVVSKKEIPRLSKFILYSAVAAKEALDQSGLPVEGREERIGCSIGVGMGALDCIESSTRLMDSKGERRISPFFIPYTIPNMASGYVSIQHGLKGPNISPATACASGTHGIGEAYRYIKDGIADAMVCGGAESVICSLGIASFTSLKALSQSNDTPELASRPFDVNRNGFVMGEGAGILVLEDLEHAQKRGAHILAEVVGYGLSGDAHHITAPADQGEGGQRCMAMALKSAGINPDEVDYINAHGTSTKMNDQLESEAIRAIFRDHADKVAISSTKGATGHCIGGAGGIESIFSILAINKGVVPPTANLHEKDPLCPLNYTPLEPQERKVNIALSNSFGFGGTNATIAFKAFK